MKNIFANIEPSNTRELMLKLTEVDGVNMSAYEYAAHLMVSLRERTISEKDYTLLSGELQLHCRRESIETQNAVCSLF